MSIEEKGRPGLRVARRLAEDTNLYSGGVFLGRLGQAQEQHDAYAQGGVSEVVGAGLTLPPGEHAAPNEQKPEDEGRNEDEEAFRRDLSRGHKDNHGDGRGDHRKDAEEYPSNVSNGRPPPKERVEERNDDDSAGDEVTGGSVTVLDIIRHEQAHDELHM